jgi:hypothetical protein
MRACLFIINRLCTESGCIQVVLNAHIGFHSIELNNNQSLYFILQQTGVGGILWGYIPWFV